MTNRRWGKILELLEKQHSVSVEDLVLTLGISEATARRDLQAMEDNGLVVRFHGGARIFDESSTEKSMDIKSLLDVEPKNKIARYAASLIKDGQVVYLDAGTTTYNMIDYIKAKGITVITNGIPHLQRLTKRRIRTFILGGFVKQNTQAVTGKETVNQIRGMIFDIAFIGTNGVHQKAGFTTPDEYEAEGKTMAIRQSKTTYILADKSKFNKLCFSKFAELDEAVVIIDQKVENFDYKLIDYVIAE